MGRGESNAEQGKKKNANATGYKWTSMVTKNRNQSRNRVSKGRMDRVLGFNGSSGTALQRARRHTAQRKNVERRLHHGTEAEARTG